MNPTPSLVPASLSRRAALRTFALGLGATAWLGRASAQETPKPTPPPAAAPPPIKSESLGGKLTLITGVGGNIVVLAGDDGGLVVDCGVPQAAAGTAAEIAKAAPGALAVLVNTHWHFDHAGGNERLAKAGARIVAHDNCRQRLSTDQVVEFMDMKSPASPKAAWPVVTCAPQGQMSLHLNGEDIVLTAVPPAHTDGDLLVHFRGANLLHMGDLFFNGFYPFIDYSSGGWISGMVVAAKSGLALCDDKTRIVPGHGPMATPADLKAYLAFLETMNDRLTKLRVAGKSEDEAVAAAPTKDFDEKWGKGFLNAEKFVRCAWRGLVKHG